MKVGRETIISLNGGVVLIILFFIFMNFSLSPAVNPNMDCIQKSKTLIEFLESKMIYILAIVLFISSILFLINKKLSDKKIALVMLICSITFPILLSVFLGFNYYTSLACVK
jgi:hypothetical protein